jgi:hypothetical protein
VQRSDIADLSSRLSPERKHERAHHTEDDISSLNALHLPSIQQLHALKA